MNPIFYFFSSLSGSFSSTSYKCHWNCFWFRIPWSCNNNANRTIWFCNFPFQNLKRIIISHTFERSVIDLKDQISWICNMSLLRLSKWKLNWTVSPILPSFAISPHSCINPTTIHECGDIAKWNQTHLKFYIFPSCAESLFEWENIFWNLKP